MKKTTKLVLVLIVTMVILAGFQEWFALATFLFGTFVGAGIIIYDNDL